MSQTPCALSLKLYCTPRWLAGPGVFPLFVGADVPLSGILMTLCFD